MEGRWVGEGDGLVRDTRWGREMAGTLCKGHTLLKTGVWSAHRQTDRQTKVKTVYPPVSLRSLGG